MPKRPATLVMDESDQIVGGYSAAAVSRWLETSLMLLRRCCSATLQMHFLHDELSGCCAKKSALDKDLMVQSRDVES